LPLWNGMSLGSIMDFLGGVGDSRRTGEAEAMALVSPATRDPHYRLQTIRAIRKGRVEEAISLLEKVESDDVKAEIRSELAARRITDAIEQGQLDTALALTRSHSDASQQIHFLTQIAQKQIDRKKPNEALLSLVEADQLLNRLPDAFSRAYFAAEIMEKMAMSNPELSFSSVARLVEEINKASGISEEPKPLLPPPNRDPLDPTTYSLLTGKGFGLLAKADFDAALAAAQSIIQPETSIAAQLSVCRAALSGTGKGPRVIARRDP